MIEVEAKFPFVGEFDTIVARLQQLGACRGDVEEQSDEYLAHPARQFAETGEAFRIRTVGSRNALTYKGPLLDRSTKSRDEIEVDFATGHDERSRMRQLLLALGFRPVRLVEKRREIWNLTWSGTTVEIALDEVAGLGRFVELETTADAQNWQTARDRLLQLATELNLGQSERRSYLELLLECS